MLSYLDDSTAHTSSITRNFKLIKQSSDSEEYEENSVKVAPLASDVSQRRQSVKKPMSRGSFEISLNSTKTKSKPNKKRVSMCGEGLTKAQLKIDETILDESENESDFKNGRIFTLHGSRLEEDLSSDENRMLKKTAGAQVIFESDCNEDDRLPVKLVKYTDASDSSSSRGKNRALNGGNIKKRMETSEDTSDDKLENCKQIKLYWFSQIKWRLIYQSFTWVFRLEFRI